MKLLMRAIFIDIELEAWEDNVNRVTLTNLQ
jgi:hypothetical protein